MILWRDSTTAEKEPDAEESNDLRVKIDENSNNRSGNRRVTQHYVLVLVRDVKFIEHKFRKTRYLLYDTPIQKVQVASDIIVEWGPPITGMLGSWHN